MRDDRPSKELQHPGVWTCQRWMPGHNEAIEAAWKAGRPVWVVMAKRPVPHEHRLGIRRAQVLLMLDRSNKDLAQHFGVSIATIVADRAAVSGKSRTEGRRKVVSAVLHLRSQGLSFGAIGAKLGITRNSVAGIVHANKVKQNSG